MALKDLALPADELKLYGLRAMAREHWEALRQIEKTASKITGENEACGYTSDWLSGEGAVADYSARELLKLLNEQAE